MPRARVRPERKLNVVNDRGVIGRMVRDPVAAEIEDLGLIMPNGTFRGPADRSGGAQA
jgi:hypothetical protein